MRSSGSGADPGGGRGLREAAPVVELPLHKVPLNQVDVASAGSTAAGQGPGFGGVFWKFSRLGNKHERLKKPPKPPPNPPTPKKPRFLED